MFYSLTSLHNTPISLFPFLKLSMKAPEAANTCSSVHNEHRHTSTRLAADFHYYFPPPSALTWLSCDGTQTFLSKALILRWLIGGGGGMIT